MHVLLYLPCGVSAQDAEQSAGAAAYEARARVRAPIAATNTEDATASGTTIDVRERTRALEGLGEAIAEVPGVRVQSTGAFGSFSGVALRGAEIGHTSVLLGSVPLTTPDTGAFDLSVLPLSVLESIEVYRGGAPVWWSDGSIGGVLRVVPRTAEQNLLRAATGYGSFGRFELSATSSVVRESRARPSLFAHVGFARADNDYRYVDDGQTRFDTANGRAADDDVVLHQRNADIHAGDGLAHAGVDAAGGRFELVLAGHGRTEGIPGPLAAPTLGVRRQLIRALAAASYTREDLGPDGKRRFRVQLVASGHHQQNRVSDLGSELGTSKTVASDDVWQRAYVRAAGGVRLLSWLESTLVGSFARDDFRPEDPLAFSRPPRPSGRSAEALAFELRAYGRLGDLRLELRPSTRLQWSRTAVWVEGAATSTEEMTDAFVTTHRIAAVVSPLRALSFSTSASTGSRLPSISELFGDRVFQEPNVRLSPERSHSVDASAVVRGRYDVLSGSAELRGFALLIDDLIRFERTAQFTVRPENIASGRIYGLEFGMQGDCGRHLSVTGSLTALRTRNQFGRELPLRPPLQFFVRPELALFPGLAERISIFAEAEHVSFVYLDEANRTFLDGRTLLSAGSALLLFDGRVTLRARVRNLFDVLATDVLSRPLPGREFLLSLAIEDALE